MFVALHRRWPPHRRETVELHVSVEFVAVVAAHGICVAWLLVRALGLVLQHLNHPSPELAAAPLAANNCAAPVWFAEGAVPHLVHQEWG
jgi:hypothetical protein